MTTETTVRAEKATLIYEDSEGRSYEQPLSDITEAGTLINPETGDDLEVVAARVELIEPDQNHSPQVSSPLVRELAACLRERGDARSVQAAAWVEAHEHDSRLWLIIGPMVDRVTALAAEEDETRKEQQSS